MTELTRRGFLGAMLAAAAAPAIVKAGSLMPVYVPWRFEDFVREVRGYDLCQDLYIHRLDVRVGAEQYSVAFSQDGYQPALEVLRQHVEHYHAGTMRRSIARPGEPYPGAKIERLGNRVVYVV